jgi:hypothetical protein
LSWIVDDIGHSLLSFELRASAFSILSSIGPFRDGNSPGLFLFPFWQVNPQNAVDEIRGQSFLANTVGK